MVLEAFILKQEIQQGWAAYEVRDGVRIRVIYEPANEKIITTFPDSAPVPPNYKPISK